VAHTCTTVCLHAPEMALPSTRCLAAGAGSGPLPVLRTARPWPGLSSARAATGPCAISPALLLFSARWTARRACDIARSASQEPGTLRHLYGEHGSEGRLLPCPALHSRLLHGVHCPSLPPRPRPARRRPPAFTCPATIACPPSPTSTCWWTYCTTTCCLPPERIRSRASMPDW
jgi:hypothetical protein